MNRPISLLLRCLGLNRSAPKTNFGRYLRRSERMFSILAVLYAALHVFPQTLFAHNLTADGITIYSRAPLPPEAALCAARAAELVQQSELSVPDRPEHIFVCDSPWLFGLFHPTSRAFACSVPITDNVFVAAADFSRDVARSSAPDYNTRSLSSVIAHEITHGLIRHRLGWARGVLLPDWVAEGYCDYVARESSFSETEGLRLLASGQNQPSLSYRYFLYRQMVQYLMEHQHLSFAQVVARASDFAAVEAETRQALRSGKSR